MRILILFVVMFALGLILLAAADEASAGYGTCYEAQPVCIQGHPLCVCDRNNWCFWACR